MIQFGSSYLRLEDRLALGIEPIDALKGVRLSHPVRIDIEGTLPWRERSRNHPYARGKSLEIWNRTYAEKYRRFPSGANNFLDRHNSCRHALLYRPGLGNSVGIRIYDHYRRYVPRRLRIPLLGEEEAEKNPIPYRIRRPFLFPGAAYDISSRVTGMRARVMRNGAPLKWARIEAYLPETQIRVALTQGDDRGEFLLILGAGSQPFDTLSDPVEIDIVISGPGVQPEPDEYQDQDPLWDLPLEVVPAPGEIDGVLAGEEYPMGYETFESVSGLFKIPLGRILTGEDDFIVA